MDPPAGGSSLFLSNLAPDLKRAFLMQGHPKHFAAGSLIFQRGDAGDSVIFIEDGIVEVSLMSQSGRKSVLNHMVQGDLLGEIAALDGKPRSADAYAKTEVRACVIGRDAIQRFLEKNPNALWGLIETLCDRVRNASDMFETRSASMAETRIARCLLKLSALWGVEDRGVISIDQHITQSDLGELSGLARENVNRHLRHLIERDVVHYSHGRFTIVNPAELKRLAKRE